MAFSSQVTITMFILMKTVIIICRGRNEGIANIETYRAGHTETNGDRQGQTGTDKDKQEQTETNND